MGCARLGKELAHGKQALGCKIFRLGGSSQSDEGLRFRNRKPVRTKDGAPSRPGLSLSKEKPRSAALSLLQRPILQIGGFVVNARFPLPNRYRHAPARGFGTPARCRAPCKGASILVQQQNRPRLRVFADYVAFKTRQGRLSTPLKASLERGRIGTTLRPGNMLLARSRPACRRAPDATQSAKTRKTAPSAAEPMSACARSGLRSARPLPGAPRGRVDPGLPAEPD